MAKFSERLNGPLTEGKENQKMWSVSSPAGKTVYHVLNFEWTNACENPSTLLMLKAISNIQLHTDWLCKS
jgi:hypothetical protein